MPFVKNWAKDSSTPPSMFIRLTTGTTFKIFLDFHWRTHLAPNFYSSTYESEPRVLDKQSSERLPTKYANDWLPSTRVGHPNMSTKRPWFKAFWSWISPIPLSTTRRYQKSLEALMKSRGRDSHNSTHSTVIYNSIATFLARKEMFLQV